MELDLSCFDRDFDRINLMIEAQLKINENKKDLLNEEVINFINENSEDIIDAMILEQVKRDQWNRQYSFLLAELGYEVIPEQDIQKRLNETTGSFFGDLAVDAMFTMLPAGIRALGVAGSLASFGVSAAAAEGIAKMLAGGGAMYYLYHAYNEYEEGNMLNFIFNIFNCLLSLEQAAIPFVSDAIAAGGRLFVRMLSGFFKVLFAPVRILKNISGQVAGRGLTIVSEKLGIKSLEKIAAYFGKNETVLTGGAKAMSAIAEGGAAAAKGLDDLIRPILKESDELAKIPGVGPALKQLEQILEINAKQFGPAAAETAEALVKSIGKGVDASKATALLERNAKVLDAIEEVLKLAAPGKPLASNKLIAGLTIKELNAVKSGLLKTSAEGTEALGKIAGQVISTDMKAGLRALKNINPATVGDDVATAMNSFYKTELISTLKAKGLYTKFPRAAKTMNIAKNRPQIVASGEQLMIKMPLLNMFGANKAKVLPVDEALKLLQSTYSKKFGAEFGEEFYKATVSSITKSPIYGEMTEAIAKTIAADTPSAAKWVSGNMWKAMVKDFSGVTSTFKALKSAPAGTAMNFNHPVFIEAAKHSKETMTFWRGIMQIGAGAGTAGTKAFDPRSASQIRMAKRQASKPAPVKSTIKTRADGTAGTTPGTKTSAVGATKTKFDVKSMA